MKPNKLRQAMIDAKAAAKEGRRLHAALMGAKACNGGLNITACPYPHGDKLYKCWLTGWRAAQDRREQDASR
jgi:ribosome modulation factor